MIANSTFYICFRNKVSGPGAGTNKAIEKLRSLRRLLYKSPGDRLSLLSNCHELILFAFRNGNEAPRQEQTNTDAVTNLTAGGSGFSLHLRQANVTTLTPQVVAAGGRPLGMDASRWVRSGSGQAPGPTLSKWNKSCQLSKSVRCPPRAWAYQAHLSLSCLCLLISMCIFLSLSPKGGIQGPVPNANYSFARRSEKEQGFSVHGLSTMEDKTAEWLARPVSSEFWIILQNAHVIPSSVQTQGFLVKLALKILRSCFIWSQTCTGGRTQKHVQPF